jgi:hypothetical protein
VELYHQKMMRYGVTLPAGINLHFHPSGVGQIKNSGHQRVQDQFTGTILAQMGR